MMENLSLLIGTYRNVPLLSDCLQSLLAHAPWDYRIYILDNDETGESTDELQHLMHSIRPHRKDISMTIRHRKENLLPRAINNTVAELVQTPYMAKIDDDVIFVPGADRLWERLVGIAGHPDVGLVAPTTLRADGLQNAMRTDAPKVVKTNFAECFCFVCRTEIWEDLGGYDEKLMNIGTDWCMRLYDAGYDIVIDRTQYVHHLAGKGWYSHLFKPGEGDRKIMGEWAQRAHNEIIRKHGVKAYGKYLQRGYDRDSAFRTTAGWDQLQEFVNKTPEEWTSEDLILTP